MKTQQINQSLKRSLFESPSPVTGTSLYKSLQCSMFGDNSRFIDFLNETDNQIRLEKAKDIILYLGFVTPFCIPSRFPLNLLSFESKSNDIPKYHVNQDHFVHSVYIYLLGIYTFFYHKSFNEELSDFFIHLRILSNQPGLHTKKLERRKAAEDYIYAWKAFSLSHDIGYPWEDHTEEQHRKIFNDTSSLVTFDCSLRALSHLTAIRALHRQERALRLETELNRADDSWVVTDGNTTQPWEATRSILDNRSKWTLLSHINGSEYARAVLNGMGKLNIVAVLEQHDIEEPLLMLYNYNDKWYIAANQRNYKKYGSIQKVKEAAYVNGTAFRLGQNWKYFTPEIESQIRLFCSSVCKTTKEQDILLEFLNKEARELCMGLPLASTDVDYFEMCYKAYKNMLSTLYDQNSPWEISRMSSMLSYLQEFQLINKLDHKQQTDPTVSITSITSITDSLRSLMTSKIDNAQTKSMNLDKLIPYHFSHWKSLDNLVQDVSDHVRTTLKSQFSTLKVKLYAHTYINNIISNNLAAGNYIFQDDSVDISRSNHNTLTQDVLDIIDEGFKSLSHVKKTSLDILNNYQPPWLKEKALDHGIASSLCLLDACNVYIQLLKKAAISDTEADEQETPLSRLLFLSLGVGSCLSKDIPRYLLYKVTPQVISCDMMHNVYPKHLPEGYKQFIVSARSQPLLYLSMFIDAIQSWSRDKLLNQGIQELPPKLTAETYNISIKGNQFLIKIGGDEFSLKGLDNSFKSKLNEYLEGASSLIKLVLAEWK